MFKNTSFIQGFKELNRIEKLFFIMLQFNMILLIYLFAHLYKTAILPFLTFCLIFPFEIIFLCKYNNKSNYLIREILLIIFFVLQIVILPCCFVSSASITFYGKKYYDETLLNLDTNILGKFFPHGQLSLYLDTNDTLGPHTILGKIIGSILQFFYFFYYLVPYQALYLHLLMRCIKEINYRKTNNGEKSKTYNKHWNELYLGFCTYNFVTLFVFFINTLVPATSPRIYYKDKYTKPLTLPGIAGFLNSNCRDNRSANSFPSGHVAETGCFAILYGLIGNWIGFVLCLFVCLLLALGTIWLRYHYFIDALVGGAIAIFCPLFVYLIGYRPMLKDNEDENTTITNENTGHKGNYIQQIDVI